MASNIASRGPLEGKPLIVFNRTPQRFEELRALLDPSHHGNVALATSAQAAARDADIIFTSFADDKSVVDMYDHFLDGCGGTAEGKLFVETSTVLPNTAGSVAEKIRQAGGEFIAMPGGFDV